MPPLEKTQRHALRRKIQDQESVLLNRRLHLVDEPLFPDNEYTANIDRVTPAMIGLANLIVDLIYPFLDPRIRY